MNKPLKKSVSSVELFNRFLDQNDRMVEYISRMDKTLEIINDQNVLHLRAIEDTKGAIISSTTVNKNVVRIFSLLLLLQSAAIIVLAGAEKVLPYFNLKSVISP